MNQKNTYYKSTVMLIDYAVVKLQRYENGST